MDASNARNKRIKLRRFSCIYFMRFLRTSEKSSDFKHKIQNFIFEMAFIKLFSFFQSDIRFKSCRQTNMSWVWVREVVPVHFVHTYSSEFVCSEGMYVCSLLCLPAFTVLQRSKGGHSLLFSRIALRTSLFFFHGSQSLLRCFWHFQGSLSAKSLLKNLWFAP